MDSEQGVKIKFGRLLTKYLRTIADEKTEFMDICDETGKTVRMTKAEALARTMWKLALGFEEQVKKYDPKTGKVKLLNVNIRPDNTMISLIWDRLEGKVGTDEAKMRKKPALSKRVDEQTKKRINELAGE